MDGGHGIILNGHGGDKKESNNNKGFHFYIVRNIYVSL